MVIGPMTVDEFSTRSFDMSDALHWNTPNTAGDSFHQLVRIVFIHVVCWALALIAFQILIYRVIRRRKAKLAASHGTSL